MSGSLRCRWALPLSLAVITGCGDDGFEPTVDNVSGSYAATVLTVEETSGTTDYLAIGSALEVTLHPDGTVDGQLFVPSLGPGGSDIDIALGGTWSLDGDQVTIDSIQDTFLQDVVFTATEGRLDGEFVGNGVSVQVRLEKPAAE
jgi:hypothetical protein